VCSALHVRLILFDSIILIILGGVWSYEAPRYAAFSNPLLSNSFILLLFRLRAALTDVSSFLLQMFKCFEPIGHQHMYNMVCRYVKGSSLGWHCAVVHVLSCFRVKRSWLYSCFLNPIHSALWSAIVLLRSKYSSQCPFSSTHSIEVYLTSTVTT
jgi:hypothetical protein